MSRRFAIAMAVLVPFTHERNAPGTNRQGDALRRTPPNLMAVSLGTEHGCGLSADGRAYCWGSNRLGQLGDDGLTPERRITAKPVMVATTERFVGIAAGANHTCAVTRSGAVYCWGLDLTGELGQAFAASTCDGFPCTRRPVRLETSIRFDSLSAGFGHTCGLSGGAAYCWGRNDRGQLGTARSDDVCGVVACNLSPVRVAGVDTFTSISAGGDHTCGMSGGAAYCWGSNQYGQLGTETPGVRNPSPIRVGTGLRLVSIEAKGIRTCGRTVEGREICWGQASPFR